MVKFAKQTCSFKCRICNLVILYAKEIAIEFSRVGIIRGSTARSTDRIASDRRNLTRCMGCRIRKVDVIREHVVFGKTAVDILELRRRADQLVVVICCYRIGAIDLVCRHSRFCPTLMPDMRIAVIYRCIRMEDHGTGRRMNICRIEDADAPAVDLNLIRRDRAHIDDIGFTDCRGAERSGAARLEGFRTNRRRLLCRDIEIPYVHRCCLAEDYAVRVDEVDVTATCNTTVDGRRIPARHDVQIIIRIISNRLALLDRVVCPLDHVIRRSCRARCRARSRDIGIRPRCCRRASDMDA